MYRVIRFLFFPALLLSLGAGELCVAQTPLNLKASGGKIDPMRDQSWPVNRDFPHWEVERDRALRVPVSPPEGMVLKREEVSRISGIVKDDFLVNDDTTGGCTQLLPAVAMDSSGDFVVCWVDERNGDMGDIYAQRYNSAGDTVGANFRVNDELGSGWQSDPSIGMSAASDFVICWRDDRSHYSGDIYAQRYNSSGDTVGANFRVNDDLGTEYQMNPSIAMDTDGDFVICWQDQRSGNYDIYAQRYNSSGDTAGANFRVNDDPGIESQAYPSIAMDAAGDFVICWYDRRASSDYDIYAQRYNSSGDTVGVNFKVNDVGTSYQRYPSVAMDTAGAFVISWEDNRGGSSDIYAQRYNSSGDTVGVNFRVNGVVTGSQMKPTIGIDSAGDFTICWADQRSGNPDIYAQRYNSSGGAVGVNFRVNDDLGTSSNWWPSVAIDTDGDFVICWYDERTGDYDIYAQRYNSSGDTVGANFRVSDDQGTTSQWEPSIAMDANGDFVICWCDYRSGDGDIYAQRYNSSGDTVGANFRVNDDPGRASQWGPSIAMDTAGAFVICWEDDRADYGDIYAQRYNNSGGAVGVNFRVNDHLAGSYPSGPSIGMDADGDFVICWEDYRSGDGDIYAQRYNSLGDTLGVNFRVNDHLGTEYQMISSIAMDSDGDFVICWVDQRSGEYDIYAQRYNSSGDTVGVNFRVNDHLAGSYPWSPSIAMDSDGDFAICWYDYRSGDYDIYAQRYNSSGDTVGANFRVNDDLGTEHQMSPSIAMDSDGDFVICWADQRSGDYDIYAQRYHSDGTSWGPNYLVNQELSVPNPNQQGPSVALNDNQITPTWEDARRSKHWDVYAKVITWDWVKVDEPEGDHVGLPQEFVLGQNYPNPFNAATHIRYHLSAVSSQLLAVSLKIFNILGQEVRTLVDKKQSAGYYQVFWNGRDNSGRDVSSGIYFYRLKAGDFVQTRKMVLIR